jgi:hypothetical protein
MVASVIVAGLAGCGGDGTDPAISGPTQVVRDPAADPEDGNYKRYPAFRHIDIRAMKVTKTGSGLRVVFQTTAPAKRGSIYSFFYNHDPDDERGGLVQARYRSDGRITADASTEPDPQVDQLPSDSVQLRGNEVVLTVPDEFLDPTSQFTWWAGAGYSVTDALEADDWVPDRTDDPLGQPIVPYRRDARP